MLLKRRIGRLALVAVAIVLAACNGLTVDQSGVYTSSPTQQITGTVTVDQNDELLAVTVNGIEATVNGEEWSVDLPLDGDAVFNTVLVEASFQSGEIFRERRTVVYGDGETAVVLPSGAVLNDAVGLRVNESSFTKLGPTIESLTTIDPGAIAPVGTVVLDACQQSVFGICTVYTRALIAAAPTIADFGVALNSNTGAVQAVVTLSDFDLDLDIEARVFGIPVNCDLEVTADSIGIDGTYTLRPDPADPELLDVNLVGASPTVTLNGFDSDFTGGVCSVPGIEQIVGLFMGDVEAMMRNNLTAMLGDPDGTGPVDSPVADATEGALANIHIAGPIGEALGLDLQSTLTAVDVDPSGLGLRATASFNANEVAPGAPDLPGSVGWGDVLGPLGSTAPGGQPFDVAVGASASGFNQLLAAEIERGLLNVDITELDGQPLTLKSLLDLIGAGDLITEDRPIVIELRPEVAPIITEGPGPNGALAELRMAGYGVTLRATDGTDETLLRVVLDFRTGITMVFAEGELTFSFDTPADEDFDATVVRNAFGLPDELVETALRALTPQVFGSVQDALPGFPVPQFVGMALQPVEVARAGSGLVLYADLVPGA
jgi:hypothetical protein